MADEQKTADDLMDVSIEMEVPCYPGDTRDAAIQFWRLLVQNRQFLATNGLHFTVDPKEDGKKPVDVFLQSEEGGYDALMAEQTVFPPAVVDDILSLLWRFDVIDVNKLEAEFIKRRGLTGTKFKSHWNRLDSLIATLTQVRDALAEKHNTAEREKPADADDADDLDTFSRIGDDDETGQG